MVCQRPGLPRDLARWIEGSGVTTNALRPPPPDHRGLHPVCVYFYSSVRYRFFLPCAAARDGRVGENIAMAHRLLIVALLGCCGLIVGCASSKGSAKTGGATATEGGGGAAGPADDGAYLASVEEKVEARMDAVQACFTAQQAREKTLAGKVRLEWTIRSDGKVDLVEVKSSTMNNGIVEDCIKRVIGGWSFSAPPRDNFVASHSFVFAEKSK